MSRVIVLGGLGFFGREIVHRLGELQIDTLRASRGPGAEILVDAEDPPSIRAALRTGDLVVDAAGPFQTRTTALLEAALEVGFNVIDINDNLAYAQKTLALAEQIEQAGIRVLPSASSVSAVSAAIVKLAGLTNPVRLHGFIVPASRHTANAGSALSLIQSVGQPVLVLRDGELRTLSGWSESRPFPMPQPVGQVDARLFESADAIHLPRTWPSLTEVCTYIDTNTPGVNLLLHWAAKRPGLRRLLQQQVSLGTWYSRILGSKVGGLGYEIEDAIGEIKRLAIVSSAVTAVAPVVLAVKAMQEEKVEPKGLISPDRQVEPANLEQYLLSRGGKISHNV